MAHTTTNQQNSPAPEPSSSAVMMVALPKSPQASAASPLSTDDKKRELVPLIHEHVIEYLLNIVFKEANKKIGVSELFAKSDVERILNLCGLLKVDSEGKTVYGHIGVDKKYIGRKGLFDLIAAIRSDFAKKPTPWKWTTHPFIEALDKTRTILQNHIDGYWPYLQSDAELPNNAVDKKDEKDEKNARSRMFPDYFITAQKAIFAAATESLGHSLNDGLLRSNEVNLILSYMEKLFITRGKDNKLRCSYTPATYKATEITGFFGLLSLFELIKEVFLKKSENQWSCGTHPFVSALDQVHQNTYDFVMRTQPQLKDNTKSWEVERDMMLALYTKSQCCTTLKFLGCLIYLIPQKILTLNSWFGRCSTLPDEKEISVGSCSGMDPAFSTRSFYGEIGYFAQVKRHIKIAPLDEISEAVNKPQLPMISRSLCGD